MPTCTDSISVFNVPKTIYFKNWGYVNIIHSNFKTNRQIIFNRNQSQYDSGGIGQKWMETKKILNKIHMIKRKINLKRNYETKKKLRARVAA